VYWSATVVALVPPGVVTETSTTPADPAGDGTLICVSLLTVKPGALVVPNRIPVVPVKPVPVIITGVPPITGPVGGEMPETAGAG
jgi:hypothetical protein